MHNDRDRVEIPLGFLLALFFCSCIAVSGSTEPPEAESNAARVVRLAVRTPAAQDALVEALAANRFLGWIAAQEGIAVDTGPSAEGDVLVHASLLSALAAPENTLGARVADLPVHLAPDAITFAGTRYDAREHTLAVRLPETSRREEWVIVGSMAEKIADMVAGTLSRHIPDRAQPGDPAVDYQVHESPYLARKGRWGQRDDSGTWTVDARYEEDQIARRATTWAEKVPLARQHVVLHVPPRRRQDPAFATLARTLDATVGEQAARIPLVVARPVKVVVEDDYVSQGRFVNAIGAAVLRHRREAAVPNASGADASGPDADVHLVYRLDDLFAYRFAVAQALVTRAGLATGRPWLHDGAALWLSRGWFGKPYDHWLPLLAAGDVLPTAEELLAATRQRSATEVLWAPVAAALIEALPGDSLRAKLAAWPEPAVVNRMLEAIAARGSAAPAPTRPKAWTQPFWSGVSMAVAPGLETGYHAPGFDRKLSYLAGLGVDSLSLMPFASQRSPDATVLGILRNSPSSEHDLGMVEGARRARSRGFRVLWKPHLWVGRSSWPGEIEMSSQADWDAWFRAYRLYVLHNALLAEWADAEMFSVGVELGKTLGQEAAWRHLITSVRRIFRRAVTYSGNWWGDYDRIPFADLLDAVGVDAYFPLASEPDASDTELTAGARRAVAQMAAVAARLDKPLLLTEVGFSAQRGAWVEPHTEGPRGDRSVLSEDHQRRAYAALLGALGNPDWLAGMFVWKVFSTANIESGESPDFRFVGRAAEAEIEGYFKARARQ